MKTSEIISRGVRGMAAFAKEYPEADRVARATVLALGAIGTLLIIDHGIESENIEDIIAYNSVVELQRFMDDISSDKCADAWHQQMSETGTFDAFATPAYSDIPLTEAQTVNNAVERFDDSTLPPLPLLGLGFLGGAVLAPMAINQVARI